jgi:2-phosphoglycerate kinase
MKATVEMCQMLKAENTKLKQDREELIEFLKKQIETKKQTNAYNKYFYEIKEIEAFLERLG